MLQAVAPSWCARLPHMNTRSTRGHSRAGIPRHQKLLKKFEKSWRKTLARNENICPAYDERLAPSEIAAHRESPSRRPGRLTEATSNISWWVGCGLRRCRTDGLDHRKLPASRARCCLCSI